MTTNAELRRIALFKGNPVFACERCGHSFAPAGLTPALGDVSPASRLEVYEPILGGPPVVRCRAYTACERRRDLAARRSASAAAQP